jgi:TPR repeat protein
MVRGLAKLCCILLCGVMLSASAHCGPLEDGLAAYDRGDYDTAIRTLRPLASRGNRRAENSMGAMYENGRGGVAQDLRRAAEWYRRAARHGSAQAQNSLGFMYIAGRGVKRNRQAGVHWFRLGAAQGFAVAQYNLGVAYEEAWGVRKSYSRAAKWFRLAADQGLEPAEHNLAVMYTFGRGVPLDHARALELYLRAAHAGYAPAQNNLGLLYLYGLGATSDLVQAHMWFNLSAEQGNEDAAENMDMTEAFMSAEQIAEAHERALLQKKKGRDGPGSRERREEGSRTTARHRLWKVSETRVTSVSCGSIVTDCRLPCVATTR